MTFEDRYFEFERQFLGSEELIAKRHETYIKYLNLAGFHLPAKMP